MSIIKWLSNAYVDFIRPNKESNVDVQSANFSDLQLELGSGNIVRYDSVSEHYQVWKGGAWVNIDEQAVSIDTKQDHENGFENRTDSDISFTPGTRTFNITPDATSYEYYYNKTPYIKTSSLDVVIDNTEGLHFIYFSGGSLLSTTTFSEALITTMALVAIIYWDVDNQLAVLFGDERHGYIMDSSTHLFNHLTFGARYATGLGLSNMDVDGSGNDASAAQFGVGNGSIWDEDIEHRIEDGNPQELSTVAEIPMLYRLGANGYWRSIAATTYPITTTGTGRAAWNEYTGGAWQLTEVGSNDYVLVHYYATNNIDEPFYNRHSSKYL